MSLYGDVSLILIQPNTNQIQVSYEGRDRSPLPMYYSFNYSYSSESIEKLQAPIHFVALNIFLFIVAAWGRGP